jgi:hypothetical protein
MEALQGITTARAWGVAAHNDDLSKRRSGRGNSHEREIQKRLRTVMRWVPPR